MSVEYAPKGLIGVLTPQANTTVEPEYAILTPPGMSWLNARMTSPKNTIEARLIDYFDSVHHFAKQFANAPINALAFACTGTSYLVGAEREDQVLAELEQMLGVPAMSAATAVVDSLKLIGAKKIALVSPYPAPGTLDELCTPYWQSRGFDVVAKTSAARESEEFHPIYSLPSGACQTALDELQGVECDAVVMLGTGMPTLLPIARTPYVGKAAVTSCMLSIVWASAAAAAGRKQDKRDFLNWIEARHWRGRIDDLELARSAAS